MKNENGPHPWEKYKKSACGGGEITLTMVSYDDRITVRFAAAIIIKHYSSRAVYTNENFLFLAIINIKKNGFVVNMYNP